MLLNKNVLNISEAAYVLNTSSHCIYNFIHTGKLQAYKDANQYGWRIPAEEIERYQTEQLRITNGSHPNNHR